MQTSQAKNIDFIPDIVVKDKDDRPIMFVTVRTSPVYGAEEFTLHGLENYQHVPFLMFVNQQYIRIYKAGNSEPVKKINPLDILKFYDPDFNETKMVQFFVMTLIESWLRDLDYHWKHSHPPAMKEIEEIGLLEKLNDIVTEELDW